MINKTLHPDDYSGLVPEVNTIKLTLQEFKGQLRFEHEHRYWEYGVALHIIKERRCHTILEVGGGCSPFHVIASRCGNNIIGVDVDNNVVESAKRLSLNVICADFTEFPKDKKYDAVVCLSVLEHVPDDKTFFTNLLDHVADGGVLIMTFDFHPSGDRIVVHHLRTYNSDSAMGLIKLAEERGFKPLETPDYTYRGAFVNGCTFASLCLGKEK